MTKLLVLLFLLAPPFEAPDAGTDGGSPDAGAAQKAAVAPDCNRLCLGKCWWDADAGYCQDTRVERLGFWDPREHPKDWGHYRYSDHADWGAFPLEARIKAANETPPKNYSSPNDEPL